MRKHKILIVDDNPLDLAIVNQMLKGVGDFDIISCQSARDAINKLSFLNNKWAPDVVFSDFMMDNGDGIDLLKNIRLRYGVDVPFVFITGVNKGILTPLIEEVKINLIAKPIRLKSLVNLLRELKLISSTNENLEERVSA